MDPNSNDAVMTTNIPGTEISVEKANVKVDGNISFEGNAEFQIFRGAEFTMQELGYGYQGKDFKVNGIRATGKKLIRQKCLDWIWQVWKAKLIPSSRGIISLWN